MREAPPGLLEQYAALSNHLEWAKSGRAAEDPVQARSVESEIRAFCDRWEGKLDFPEFDDALREMRAISDRMRTLLEGKFLEDLRDLVEKRHSVLLQPLLFEAEMKVLEIWKVAPAAMRPELEKAIQGDRAAGPFDPERFYRQMETDAENVNADYQRAFASMEASWADRFDAETRDRLSSADLAEAQRWRLDLANQLGVPPN
jgi:hypothetical protein